MTPEEREELLAGYALGTLSAPDAADAEDLVRGDVAAAEELARYYEIVDLIALSVPLRRSDPSLRERVLRAARQESGRHLPSRWARMKPYLPAAGLAAAVAFVGIWAVNLQQSLGDMREEMSVLSQVVEAEAKRVDAISDSGQQVQTVSTTLEKRLSETETLATVLLDPDVVKSELESTRSWINAGGTYFWSPAADAGVLRVHDLPPLPFGSQYRIWLEDRFSRTVAATEFAPDEVGSATVVVQGETAEYPVRLYVVATSDLDSDTPNGPVVLQGTISREPQVEP